MSLKIGITERGDAGLDFSWIRKVYMVDGVILITKSVNPIFVDKVVSIKDKPIIVHATCTGYGGTALEPNVPNVMTQINGICNLISLGFPANRIVFRIDPIFPTNKGVKRFEEIMSLYLKELKPLGITRVRISILDEYNHVKKRFNDRGWNCIYTGMYPSYKDVELVAQVCRKYNVIFETCAEEKLTQLVPNSLSVGCVSEMDLNVMGLNSSDSYTYNPQNRKGCSCMSCKTELLERRQPCEHGCVYCYWK